jgi:hypothetical protein
VRGGDDRVVAVQLEGERLQDSVVMPALIDARADELRIRVR